MTRSSKSTLSSMARSSNVFIVATLLAVCGCGGADNQPGLFSSMGYHIGKQHVWLKSPDGGGRIYRVDEVVGADPATFKSKELDNGRGDTRLIGFDKSNVYFGSDKFENADLRSLEYVGLSYFRDKNQAYYFNSPISDDSANFEQYEDFVRDSHHVYFAGRVFSSDPQNFRRLDGSEFYVDSLDCWFRIVGLEDADPASLKPLSESVAVDRNHVFHQSNLIEEADPKTFKVLDEIYSSDDTHVFYHSMLMEDADPKSFSILNRSVTKDDKRCFYSGRLLKNADPKSIELIDEFYFKDVKYVWINGLPIEGADPKTFEVIDSHAAKSRDSNRQYEIDKPR
ncbi:MAG: DKNYY domain-containing protein [Pirellulales bacterium]